MAGEVGVGAIGAVVSLRWGTLGDMFGGKKLVLYCFYPCLVHIFSRSRI